MQRTVSFLMMSAIVLIAQDLMADTRSDLLSLTGNARTNLVWVRWPWCDNNYNPIQARKSDDYEQNHPFTQLMGLSTDEGAIKFIDSTLGYHSFPRITRKTGEYVIWNDRANNCSWIRDIACTTPKRKLIDGGDYWVVACQYNPVSDSEYIYVFVNYFVVNQFFSSTSGKGLARIPLKAGNIPDLTAKKTLITTGPFDPTGEDGSEEAVMQSVSVSQDGKYLACAVPIPNTLMLEAATGTRIDRHDRTQEYGCQTNIAPDNSYRFYHLGDSHTRLSMFAAGTAASAALWYVEIMAPMPGSTYGSNNCLDPRWANTAQFFTNAYPLETGLVSTIFSMSASQVQAANASRAGTFCFAKFSADFKTVTGAVKVSDGDVRHREGVGDAWVTPPNSGASPRASPDLLAGPPSGRMKGLRCIAEMPSVVTVNDMSGRTLRCAAVGTGGALDLSDMHSGAYVVTVRSAQGVGVERVSIQR